MVHDTHIAHCFLATVLLPVNTLVNKKDSSNCGMRNIGMA